MRQFRKGVDFIVGSIKSTVKSLGSLGALLFLSHTAIGAESPGKSCAAPKSADLGLVIKDANAAVDMVEDETGITVHFSSPDQELRDSVLSAIRLRLQRNGQTEIADLSHNGYGLPDR